MSWKALLLLLLSLTLFLLFLSLLLLLNADNVRKDIVRRTGNQWWAERLVPILPGDRETLPRARMLQNTLRQQLDTSAPQPQVSLSSVLNSCLALPCLALSCLVLSCLVLSCLVLSGLTFCAVGAFGMCRKPNSRIFVCQLLRN